MSAWRPPLYEAVDSLVDDNGKPTALLCMRCGVLVGEESIHNAWHQRVDPAQVVPWVTGGLTPAKLVEYDDDYPEWTI